MVLASWLRPAALLITVRAAASSLLDEAAEQLPRAAANGTRSLCGHPSCKLTAWQDIEPKRISSGEHIFMIRPGPHVPPQVFGYGSTPRPYILYVPTGYRPETPVTLWIHAPGTAVKMETVYDHNKNFAEKHNIAMVFLSGLNYKMNVIGRALSHSGAWPDDVAYTQVTLRTVLHKINVDKRNIHCVGFSRGARFCSRLASELSAFIASVAGVAGIRYPVPNNATKPVPIIAFHGLHDPINPFGGGGPQYWGESVPETIQQWSDFNGCADLRSESQYSGIETRIHSKCRDNATVILYKLLHRGHVWPEDLPINIRETILDFLSRHADTVQCHTVQAGELPYSGCYKHMEWVRDVGFRQQSFLYEGLEPNSSLWDIQLVLHTRVYANCPMPCSGASTAEGGGARAADDAAAWSSLRTEMKTGAAEEAAQPKYRGLGKKMDEVDTGRSEVLSAIGILVLLGLAAFMVALAAVQIRRASTAIAEVVNPGKPLLRAASWAALAPESAGTHRNLVYQDPSRRKHLLDL